MPRIADVLDRESRTVDLEHGDFERLLGRRDRKERNRRIRAGAVGVISGARDGDYPRPFDDDVGRSPGGSDAPAEAARSRRGPYRGGQSLVAQDPESGEVRTIVDAKTLPERAEDITGAAWSPDRRWVAFRAGGLWVAGTIGGAPRRLTADQGWFPWAWSPTEDQLAVVLGDDVTLIDAATRHETDLGTVVGPEDIEGNAVHSLVWSPDGTRIAYDGGPGWGSVYSIDVESGEHTLLVRQPAGTGEIKYIDWSPDGAHLAISYVDASYIANHKAELGPVWYKAKALYLANADGSDLRLLDRIVASDWGVWHPGMSVGPGPSAGTAAWSPDGTRLAYTSFSGPDHSGASGLDGLAGRLGPIVDRVATVACQMEGVRCGRPTAHRSPSKLKTEGAPPTSSGPSGCQRRRNGRTEGDRRADVPELGRRLVLLSLLRVKRSFHGQHPRRHRRILRDGRSLTMKPDGRLLAALLLVALAGCGSGGAAPPTAAKTTDEPTSAATPQTSDATPADRPVEPQPAASGTLAYVLDGDIYVADPDGSNAVRIANGRPDEDCDRPFRWEVLRGGGIDVVAGRAVPRLSLQGLFQPGVRRGRRDQRR